MSSKVGIIFLHGSGSNGHEMRNALNSIPLETYKQNSFCDVILRNLNWCISTPTADKLPYDVCDGEYMNVWFNRLPSFELNGVQDSYEDVENVNKSLEKVFECIEDLLQQGCEAFFVGGFSMGGCQSLHILTEYTKSNSKYEHLLKRILGIFCVSSFLINDSIVNKSLEEYTKYNHHDKNKNIFPEVFICHGANDGLVHPQWGSVTATNLMLNSNHQVDVQFKLYGNEAIGVPEHNTFMSTNAHEDNGGWDDALVDHELISEELIDILDWMHYISTKWEKKKQAFKNDDALADEKIAAEVMHEYKCVQEDKDGSYRGIDDGATSIHTSEYKQSNNNSYEMKDNKTSSSTNSTTINVSETPPPLAYQLTSLKQGKSLILYAIPQAQHQEL